MDMKFLQLTNKYINLRNIIFVCLMHAFAVFESASAKTTGIVAVIHDNIITKKDLDDRIKLYLLMSGAPKALNQKISMRLRKQIKNIMIEEYIKLSILQIFESTNKNNFKERDLLEHYQGSIGIKDIIKLCRQHNISKEVLLNHIKADIIWQSYIRTKYKSQFTVSEKEIDNFVQTQESLAQETHYLMAEIVLNKQNRPMMEVRKDVENIVAMLRSGQQFSIIARHFSHSPSAAIGGMLGFVAHSQLDENLREQIDQISDGTCSPPIDLGDSVAVFAKISQSPYNPKTRYFGTKYRFGSIVLQISDFKTLNNAKIKKIMSDFHDKIPQQITVKQFNEMAKEQAKYSKQLNNKLAFQKVERYFNDESSFMLVNILESLADNKRSQPMHIGDNQVAIFCLFNKEKPDTKTIRNFISQSLVNKKIGNIMAKEMQWLRNNIHIKEYNE